MRQGQLIEWASYQQFNGGAISDYIITIDKNFFLLAVSRMGYHGLLLKVKNKHNRLTSNQAARMQIMEEQGYFVVVCSSPLDAQKRVIEYLGG